MSLVVVLAIAGCVKGAGQNTYLAEEVGVSRVVQFATVIQSRYVDITGKNSGVGAMGGAALGAGSGGYIGQGSGSAWAMAGGAIIGAAAGAMAEQRQIDRRGVEYILTQENGRTVTLVQEVAEGERVFKSGERVMIQTSGSYQRVIPADTMPTSIPRPKGLKVIDEVVLPVEIQSNKHSAH